MSCWEGAGEQVLVGVPQDPGQAGVGVQEGAVQADQRHPDRGVHQRQPEAGLSQLQVLLGGAHPVGRQDVGAGAISMQNGGVPGRAIR